MSKSLDFDRPISVVDNSDYCIAQYDKTTENSGLKVCKSIVRMRVKIDTAWIWTIQQAQHPGVNNNFFKLILLFSSLLVRHNCIALYGWML